jgi:hypothetical protein
MKNLATACVLVCSIFLVAYEASATANYVYHEQTSANPGCGGPYLNPVNPQSGTPITIRFKVEYQFYTNQVRVYYTTDGTNPAGSFGIGSGQTQVANASYECIFGVPTVDVAVATIPALTPGQHLKYVIGAWHDGGGPEVFANSGSCNVSSCATVFAYDVPVPIQLSGLVATSLGNSHIRLDWQTISEINNYGFYVERRANVSDRFAEVPNSFSPGHGTTNVPQHYSYIDSAANPGTWYYRLKQCDLDGTVSYSDVIRVDLRGHAEEFESPVAFSLLQNYPNPFNPSTTVKYQLPQTSHVLLTVYDILGREVSVLVNERRDAGIYEVRFDGSNLASGVYFYRIQAGDYLASKKMLILK